MRAEHRTCPIFGWQADKWSLGVMCGYYTVSIVDDDWEGWFRLDWLSDYACSHKTEYELVPEPRDPWKEVPRA